MSENNNQTRKQEAKEKEEKFIAMRSMAMSLSEEMIMERINAGWEKYQRTKVKDDRPISWLMLMTLKWGDEDRGRKYEDIVSDTKKITNMHMIHHEMEDIKDNLKK